MKILVTGATGFIGKYVINELLKFNHHNIIASGIENKEEVKKFDWFNEVEYLVCDLNEPMENFFTFFKEPELLIHLAWQGLPNYKELFHFEKNVPSNYYFIKNLIKNGLKDISVIGTCLEYGMIEGKLSEAMKTNPVTPYGLAKDTLRKYLQQLKNKYEFKFRWIRLFYMYGEGQNPNSIIPHLNKALDANKEVFNMSGGEQIRDYLPIEKVAEYIVEISLQEKVLGIINCCNGEPISIRKLVENILKKRNKTIKLNLGYYPYPDYVPMSFWGDNSKLKQIIEGNRKL
ncbi:MAG: NAD-dependent epimerase/dehydratase family protein [Promethearchaeota archaeon]